MLTRTIILAESTGWDTFQQLCDMLRACDLYEASGEDSGHFWITVRFLNLKHYRIFLHRLRNVRKTKTQ